MVSVVGAVLGDRCFPATAEGYRQDVVMAAEAAMNTTRRRCGDTARPRPSFGVGVGVPMSVVLVKEFSKVCAARRCVTSEREAGRRSQGDASEAWSTLPPLWAAGHASRTTMTCRKFRKASSAVLHKVRRRAQVGREHSAHGVQTACDVMPMGTNGRSSLSRVTRRNSELLYWSVPPMLLPASMRRSPGPVPCPVRWADGATRHPGFRPVRSTAPWPWTKRAPRTPVTAPGRSAACGSRVVGALLMVLADAGGRTVSGPSALPKRPPAELSL